MIDRVDGHTHKYIYVQILISVYIVIFRRHSGSSKIR